MNQTIIVLPRLSQLAWLPIVGDALTVIAGALKVNTWAFLALVGVGKALRYVVILWDSQALTSLVSG